MTTKKNPTMAAKTTTGKTTTKRASKKVATSVSPVSEKMSQLESAYMLSLIHI
jgi:hypothetical protein